jgi:predicted metal-dependent enzyme (double-stranded beta helix superfamily)
LRNRPVSAAKTAQSLDALVSDIAPVVRAGGAERTVTAEVADRLREALGRRLEVYPAMMRPHADRYVMYPLYVAPDQSFSVASAVWNTGQRTPIHDHGVWGVVGIHSGSEHELRYQCPELLGTGPLTVIEENLFHPGDVTVCCTSDRDIHRVSCGSPMPCVGIHIYGGNIGTIRRRSYDEHTGKVSYFISRWETPSCDQAASIRQEA